jgi:hypothetical protein
LKQTLQAVASKPTDLTALIRVETLTSGVARMLPVWSSCETSTLTTPGVACRARVTRPEQHPQVMPVIESV